MNAPLPLAERATLTHLELVLRQVRMEATGINSYEFVDADGNELPAFTAGAHIDVHIAPGVIRQYSLCNSPEERHRYVVAVLRDEAGRGGSRGMHETLRVPNRVKVSVPRNNFPLAEGAKKIIMLAGGIGVTPLKSMVHRLEAKWVDYELHYCAKGLQYAAFESELRSIARIGKIHCHFDGGDPKKGLNIAKLLKHPEADTHIYYCGPGGVYAGLRGCRRALATGARALRAFQGARAKGTHFQRLARGGICGRAGQIRQEAHRRARPESGGGPPAGRRRRGNVVPIRPMWNLQGPLPGWRGRPSGLYSGRVRKTDSHDAVCVSLQRRNIGIGSVAAGEEYASRHAFSAGLHSSRPGLGFACCAGR
ncbi:ferredoxin reductase [Cupriavidus sp. H18C2]|uniref:ferredoxin reductase n=1 Tax=Cupriavidus sp. H18C2 TaxID=3241602 RepID=UPI003BF8279A